MLWKESYKIGAKLIDDQHKGLYDYTEQLVAMLENRANPPTQKQLKEAVTLVKNHVIQHFKDEEKYQRAIDYIGYDQHKKVHDVFLKTLLDYEKRLIETDYNILIVQELVGVIIYWLVNHITDYDLKINQNRTVSNPSAQVRKYTRHELNDLLHDSCREAISTTFRQIFDTKVVGFKKRDEAYKMRGDIFCRQTISISEVGTYEFVMGYRNDFSLKLINQFAGNAREFKKVDKIVESAMAELTDIMSTRVQVLMEDNHAPCVTSPVEMRNERFEERKSVRNHEVIYIEVVTKLGSYDTMIYH